LKPSSRSTDPSDRGRSRFASLFVEVGAQAQGDEHRRGGQHEDERKGERGGQARSYG